MLYIFHVDTGTMLSVDMNCALDDCNALKNVIESITKIPPKKQVLLASGGESLEPNVRVVSYSAGTDTNPIYLFSCDTIEGSKPPIASPEVLPNYDIDDDINKVLNLPATIQTINLRCQLAQQITEKGTLLFRLCERIVHDQYLQHQGWTAVIANLEDVSMEFKNRCELFESLINNFLDSRPHYVELLDRFKSNIEELSKIPLSSELLRHSSTEEFETHPETKAAAEEGEEHKSEAPNISRKTLLEWVEDKDKENTVDILGRECIEALDLLSKAKLDDLINELKSTQEHVQRTDYREIKGLDDRLFGLNNLNMDCDNILKEQKNISQAFLQMQQRVRSIGDPSILPDLCASHKKQLLVMQENHLKIVDIMKRCYNAKQELVTNLHHRLKLIVFTENRISQGDVKMMFYSEFIRHLKLRFSIIEQLSLAPSLYMSAMEEVVRRRAFSDSFLFWANDLSCTLYAIVSEEVARRKNFHSKFDGHFLMSLFPGLEDEPPMYATQAPPAFDENLPKLTQSDIECLKSEIPELSQDLTVPDTSSFTQFFSFRTSASMMKQSNHPVASIEDQLVEAVSAACLSDNLDPALLQPTDSSQSMATTTHPISSDRGFESETDTEEFEKVGQSLSDAAKIQVQEAILKDPLSLCKIGSSLTETMSELRSKFGNLKDLVLCQKSELDGLIAQVIQTWSSEKSLLEKQLAEKDNIIAELIDSKRKLESDSLEYIADRDKARETAFRLIESFYINPSAGHQERQTVQQRPHPRQAIRSISESQLGATKAIFSDPLHQQQPTSSQHFSKSELLSDSDHQVSTTSRHLSKSDLNRDSESQASTSHRFSKSELFSDSESQPSVSRHFSKSELLSDSEQQMSTSHHSTNSELLSDSEPQVSTSRHISKSELLSDSDPQLSTSRHSSIPQSEKPSLSKCDVQKQKISSSSKIAQNVSPSASIVTIESSALSLRDAATSPEPSPKKSSKGQAKDKSIPIKKSFVNYGLVTAKSCNEGDVVLVNWDDEYFAYTIYQEAPSHPYFLNLDCLHSLGLLSDEQKGHKARLTQAPTIQYVIGKVTHKEFCQARKAENRYNVPVGAKFYRIRVKRINNSAPSTSSQGVQCS